MVTSQNAGLGAAVSVFNAVGEQADTRSWEALPGNICYARLKLPAGQQKITLNQSGQNKNQNTDFTVNVKKGETTFINFRSFGSMPLNGYRAY